jgi:aspartyl-tRNA(Asn)/glutamyl-tRNA(Gln) amidotransferase subunit B
MEEDAGKSVHEGMPDAGGKSLVDLNRSGVPLVEIVSEPDFRSSQEAYDYMTHLRKTLLYLHVCDGNMEEGSLRCDANVSVRAAGSDALGTKVEIKNLNSFRFLQKALDYEIERQTRVLEEGGRIHQETRLWDDARGCTSPMRSKEEAHDYRYFPEPDLPPLNLDPSWIAAVEKELPELPDAKLKRFREQYSLPVDDALQLTSSLEMADYYEAAAAASGNPRAAANWIIGDLAFVLKETGRDIGQSPVAPANVGELIRLTDSGEISGKIAKNVFDEICRTGEDPRQALQRLGLVQVSDEASLSAVIAKVMSANPKQLAEFRAGKERVFGYFVGQVMKETRGQANPAVLTELLRKKLATP